MKKFRLIVCAAAAMLLGTLNAGATDWTGKGSAVSSVTVNSGSPTTISDNKKIVYIYNVATGQFINIGNKWGTEMSLLDYGTPFTVKQSGSAYRFVSSITAEPLEGCEYETINGKNYGFIGFMDGFVTGDKGDYYIDRGAIYGLSDFTLTAVEGKTNVYTFTFTPDNTSEAASESTFNGNTYYMSANGKGAAVSYKASSETVTTNEQWVLVTKAQLIDNFTNSEAASATEASPADGTYNIYDPHFTRKNNDVAYWKTGSSMSGSLSNGNAEATTTATYTDWHGSTAYSKTYESLPHYYVGYGYAQSDNTDNITENYGGYSCANIIGDGQVAQTITVTASGWYLISCDGFTNQSGTAKLFASVAGSTNEDDNTYKDVELSYLSSNVPTTYYDAGKLLYSNSYNHTVMVYVDLNGATSKTITIGVKTSGTDNDQSYWSKAYYNCGWACFDDFQVKYCGGSNDVFLVLSDQETSVNYINAQVDPKKNYSLVLDRNLKANQWNSFILPIKMTAQQFKMAFGTDAKISKISGLSGQNGRYSLKFTSVDIENDNNTAVEPGTLYIVRPTTAPSYEAGKTYTIKKRVYAEGADDPTYEDYIEDGTNVKTVTTKNNYYLINQMSLTKALTTTTGIVEQTNVPGAADLTGELTFKGTYTYQTNEETIPVNSFILGSDGNWYYTQSKTYPVKGFRTWIETSKKGNVKEVTFSIDGVEEGTVTAIRGIENDLNMDTNAVKNNKVYSINGQLVRSGSTSLEGLAKGIYIVNGNKYIVK